MFHWKISIHFRSFNCLYDSPTSRMPWVHIQTSRTDNHRQTGICTEKGIAQISAYTKEPAGCEIIIHILPALTTNQKEFSNPWIGMRQNTSSLVLRYSFPLQALVIRQSQNIYSLQSGKSLSKLGRRSSLLSAWNSNFCIIFINYLICIQPGKKAPLRRNCILYRFREHFTLFSL